MGKRRRISKVELGILRPVVVLVARRRTGPRNWRGEVGCLRSRSRHAGSLRGGLRRGASLTAIAAIVLGSNVNPAMGFFHVLLAVAGTFRGIGALVELTLVQGGLVRVSVVHVTVTFFLGGPTFGVVTAVRILALPGASVCLLVFPMNG